MGNTDSFRFPGGLYAWNLGEGVNNRRAWPLQACILVKEMQKDAKEVLQYMKSPEDFLLESLQLWHRLVFLLQLDPAQLPNRPRRKKNKVSKGSKGSKGSSKGSKSSEAVEVSQEPRRFEQVLRSCWTLLGVEIQQHFMTIATAWLTSVMHQNLLENLEKGDVNQSIEDRLQGQLAHMTALMQSGAMAQCGDYAAGCVDSALLILVKYEKSVNLSPGPFAVPEDKAERKNQERIAKHFYHRATLHNFRFVPAPTAKQCGVLKKWKDALEPLQAVKASSSSPKAMSSKEGLCGLSDALLCSIAGLVFNDWADFARLAPCCLRLRSIALKGDSWKVVPVLGSEFFGSREKDFWAHFDVDRGVLRDGDACLSRKVVGLLLLALRTFSKKPLYLSGRDLYRPEYVRLWSLAMIFDLPGLRPCFDFKRDSCDPSGMRARQVNFYKAEARFC